MELTNGQNQHLYTICFRLTHVEHADRKWETMTDAWLEWEGMNEIVAANRGKR